MGRRYRPRRLIGCIEVSLIQKGAPGQKVFQNRNVDLNKKYIKFLGF